MRWRRPHPLVFHLAGALAIWGWAPWTTASTGLVLGARVAVLLAVLPEPGTRHG